MAEIEVPGVPLDFDRTDAEDLAEFFAGDPTESFSGST
jgi:hypothetical protein